MKKLHNKDMKIDLINLSANKFMQKYFTLFEEEDVLLRLSFIVHLENFALLDHEIMNKILQIVKVEREKTIDIETLNVLNGVVSQLNSYSALNFQEKLDRRDKEIDSFLDDIDTYVTFYEKYEIDEERIREVYCSLDSIDKIHDRQEERRMDENQMFRRMNRLIYQFMYKKTRKNVENLEKNLIKNSPKVLKKEY